MDHGERIQRCVYTCVAVREEYRIWARLEPDGPEWKSIQSQHSSASPARHPLVPQLPHFSLPAFFLHHPLFCFFLFFLLFPLSLYHSSFIRSFRCLSGGGVIIIGRQSQFYRNAFKHNGSKISSIVSLDLRTAFKFFESNGIRKGKDFVEFFNSKGYRFITGSFCY